jgi:hypothetical protein
MPGNTMFYKERNKQPMKKITCEIQECFKVKAKVTDRKEGLRHGG